MCVARPEHSPSIIGTNLIRLSLDHHKIASDYFTSLFSYFPESVNQLRASTDKGAYSFMNTTVIKSFQIPLPPVTLQNEFAAHMMEVGVLSKKQSESHTQLNNLFQLLLQRAFSGDLTSKWREAHMSELLTEMEQQAKILGTTAELHYEQLPLIETPRHST